MAAKAQKTSTSNKAAQTPTPVTEAPKTTPTATNVTTTTTATNVTAATNMARSGPTHEQIARRAYELFLARGGAPGRAEEDWAQAERELRLGRY